MAQILAMSGTVQIYRRSSSEWLPATVGEYAFEGDKIHTFERSKATLRLSGYGTAHLRENTTLTIFPPKRPKGFLEVLKGSVLYFFRKSPESEVIIEMPHGVGKSFG